MILLGRKWANILVIFISIVCLIGFENNKAAMAELRIDEANKEWDPSDCAACLESVQNGLLTMELDHTLECFIDSVSKSLYNCSHCRKKTNNQLVTGSTPEELGRLFEESEQKVTNLQAEAVKLRRINRILLGITRETLQRHVTLINKCNVTSLVGFLSGVFVGATAGFCLGFKRGAHR